MIEHNDDQLVVGIDTTGDFSRIAFTGEGSGKENIRRMLQNQAEQISQCQQVSENTN